MIRIELVRAWPHRSEAVTIELAEHATVGDALMASGWTLDLDFIGLALHGVAATLSTSLHDGDRLELLRGLHADPKQARRMRALRSRKPA